MSPSPEAGHVPLSGLGADAILEQVLPRYTLPQPLQCRFLMWEMYGNYLV